MLMIKMMMSASLMILVIEAVRRFAGSRLPRYTFCILWMLVCVRLFVPFRLECGFGILSVADRLLARFAGGSAEAVNSAFLAEEISGIFAPPGAAGTAAYAAENGYIHFSLVLKLFWAAGAAALGAYFVMSYVRSLRRFRESLPVDQAPAEELRKGLGIRRKVRLRESDYITSPVTYGIFRPVILLPSGFSQMAEEQELTHVLLHEMVHIRRLDALAKLVLTAAVCVYWFNPLVWIMSVLADRDMELSCDEAVVGILGRQARADYAMTLVRFAEQRHTSLFSFNSFGKSILSQRVKRIMKCREWGKAGLLAACGICLAVFMISGTASDFSARNQGAGEPVSADPAVLYSSNPSGGGAAAAAADQDGGEIIRTGTSGKSASRTGFAKGASQGQAPASAGENPSVSGGSGQGAAEAPAEAGTAASPLDLTLFEQEAGAGTFIPVNVQSSPENLSEITGEQGV
ncbi:MAG: M56 family metallopeptidase [Anaerovoracaceae bacterium]